MASKAKKDQVYEAIIDKEMSFHGLKMKDIIGVEDWFTKYTMTDEQHKEWKEFSITLMMKELRFSKRLAEKEFIWINLNHGLRILDNE